MWLIISLFLIFITIGNAVLVFDGSGRQNIFFVIFIAAITYFITRSYLGEEFNYFEVYGTYVIVKYLGSAKNIIYYQNVDGWKYLGYSTNSHTEHVEFRDLNGDFLCNFYMYSDDKYVSKLLSPIIYRMERGEFPSWDVQKEIYGSLHADHPEYAACETDAELAIEYLKQHPAVSGLTGEGAYVLHDGGEDEK
ncbi:hypothetical protein [Rothia dentocariosa]|uniref:hypothetical protein n=1 Tax=Rothia dentocariosa TaxID=2047 RepID=UPI0001E06952|nr:hypothetical protein [Rothia dentocariosa]EFJ76665.1 hypothetical protein HMPREF0734_01545 [Rothia dentocariosa M567]QKI08635.1 hypothetical protein FOC60_01520 [Rothia dentocariosa]